MLGEFNCVRIDTKYLMYMFMIKKGLNDLISL